MRQDRRDVVDRVDQSWQEAELDELMDAIREEARRNDHECGARHVEEGAQVESQPSTEDQYADSGGDEETNKGTHDDRESLIRCRGGLPKQEERCLNALANHCGEGEQAQAKNRRRGNSAINPAAQLRAKGDGLLAHPKEHVGEDHHCKE